MKKFIIVLLILVIVVVSAWALRWLGFYPPFGAPAGIPEGFLGLVIWIIIFLSVPVLFLNKKATVIKKFIIVLLISSIVVVSAPTLFWIGLYFSIGIHAKMNATDYLVPKESPIVYLEKQPQLILSAISTEVFLSQFLQNIHFPLTPSNKYKKKGEYPDYNLKYYTGFTQLNPHIKLWAHTTATLSKPSSVIEGFFRTETENKIKQIPSETDQIAIDYFSNSAKLFVDKQYHEQIEAFIQKQVMEYSKASPSQEWKASITFGSIELSLRQGSVQRNTDGTSAFIWEKELTIKKIPSL